MAKPNKKKQINTGKKGKKPIKKAIKAKQKSVPKPIAQPNFWLSNPWATLILLILPFLIYGQGIGYGYILDDAIVLSENNYVKEGFAGLYKIFTTESFAGFLGEQQNLVAGARYRPLSIASFAVEYELAGLNPWLSHIVNIILYALTGLLIFRLFSMLLSRFKVSQWWLGIPFLAALLFILHPVHTEAVANIKGRDEIMAMLFSLSALYSSFRYLQNKNLIWLGISLASFFLGLLAKENTITFLAVIPLTVYFFDKRSLKEYAFLMIPLFIVTLIYLGIRTSATGALFASQVKTDLIMNNPFKGTTFGERYATIMYTLGLYIKLLVFPHPLTHDYYPYHIPIINWLDWRALLSLVLYVGLGIYALLQFKKKSILSWCILFYIITLSIVSNILFSVGTFMNERFLFISSLGFTLALSYLIIERLPKVIPANLVKVVTYGLLLLIVAGYFIKSYTRVPVWENELTLNSAAIKVSKNSARANQFMGYTLYRQGVDEKDRSKQKALYDEATPYIDRALSIVPYYKDAIKSKAGLLGGYYGQDRDLDKVLNGFHELLKENHVDFIDQYLEYLNPREDQNKLIAFYHKTGFELLTQQKQDYPLAEKYLNYAYALDNQSQIILEDLALMYFQKGDGNRARQFYNRAIGLYPDSARMQTLSGKL